MEIYFYYKEYQSWTFAHLILTSRNLIFKSKVKVSEVIFYLELSIEFKRFIALI